MAYNKNHRANFGHIDTLTRRFAKDFATKKELKDVKDTLEGIVSSGGEPNKIDEVRVNGTTLSIVDKVVDLLIAEGTKDGTIKFNNVDIAVRGLMALAYKANVSEEELEEALKAKINGMATSTDLSALTTKVTTLIAEDVGKSVRKIANEELSKQLIAENADEAMDTLEELSAWFQSHPGEVGDINKKINDLITLVGKIPQGKTSTNIVDYIAECITAIGIGDYAKTAEVAQKIEDALKNYYNKSEIDAEFAKYYTRTEIDDMVGTDEELKEILDTVLGPEGE